MTTRVSLGELTAAGIQLRAADAVTIVSDICRQYLEGSLRGIPWMDKIRLTCDGNVVAQGPMPTDPDPVFRAARLLDELVGDVDAAPEYRASGGLRLVIARGLGTLDLPPYRSLEEFRVALARFASLDVQKTARDLFVAAMRARRVPEPRAVATLTISDVRRARRATGLPLHAVARAAGVPAARLRDLEWGDVRRWAPDEHAREMLVGYARAAGLDEKVVCSVAWPLIQELSEVDSFETPSIAPLVAAAPREAPVARPVVSGSPVRARSPWSPAVALVLGIAVVARPSEAPPGEIAAGQNAVAIASAQPQAVAAARPVIHAPARAKAVRPRAVRAGGVGAVIGGRAKVREAMPRRGSHATISPDAHTDIDASPTESPNDGPVRGRATYQDVPEPPARIPFLEKPLLRIVIR